MKEKIKKLEDILGLKIEDEPKIDKEKLDISNFEIYTNGDRIIITGTLVSDNYYPVNLLGMVCDFKPKWHDSRNSKRVYKLYKEKREQKIEELENLFKNELERKFNYKLVYENSDLWYEFLSGKVSFCIKFLIEGKLTEEQIEDFKFCDEFINELSNKLDKYENWKLFPMVTDEYIIGYYDCLPEDLVVIGIKSTSGRELYMRCEKDDIGYDLVKRIIEHNGEAEEIRNLIQPKLLDFQIEQYLKSQGKACKKKL